MILGLRPIVRHRFGAPVFAGGNRLLPTPTVDTVSASVDDAPRSEWELDDAGGRTRRVIVLTSWVELRGPSDVDQWCADHVIVDGRTYRVRHVVRADPFEGSARAHYESDAVEIQSLTWDPPVIVPPTNVDIPAIRTEGDWYVAQLGTWDGTPPFTFGLRWLVDGDPFSIADRIPADTEGTIVLEVTASNDAGDDVALSQPISDGGSACDCEDLEDQIATLTAARDQAIAERDAIQELLDAAEATIATQATTITNLQGQIGALNTTITGLNTQIATLTTQRDAALAQVQELLQQIAELGPDWRAFAFDAPSVIRDPLGLLVGTPTRSNGVISATLAAGVTAAGLHEGAALVWPLTDALGRALSSRTGIGGFLRAITPLLGAPGSGIRIAVAVLDGDDPAAVGGLGGYAIGLIAHATTGQLAVVWNGTGGATWTPATATGAGSNGTADGVLGGWQMLPSGASQVYRTLYAGRILAPHYTGVGATSNAGVSLIAGRTAASFRPTHIAAVVMTTAPLASPTNVQFSPQAGLLDLDHTDPTGAPP